jgi:hypothetical protein
MTTVYFSLRSLNSCTEHTHLAVRITLILYFTSSVGALLTIGAGTYIDWPFGLVIVANALHLCIDRRQREHRRKITNFNPAK